MGDGTYAVADARRLRWLDRRVNVAVRPGGYGAVGALEWLRSHRVFALVEGTGPVAAGPVPWTLVDARHDPRRRPETSGSKRSLQGYIVAKRQDRDREVLLVLSGPAFGRSA